MLLIYSVSPYVMIISSDVKGIFQDTVIIIETLL